MQLSSIKINDRMEHYRVNGLSIAFIDNGLMSSTENYGVLEVNKKSEVNEHSIFNACSISKFLTGILVITLIEEGKLQLDEDVNKRLKTSKVSKNKFTKHKKVTLRNLLSHQSGIKDPDGSFSEINSSLPTPTMVELLEGKSPYCNTPIEIQYEPESEFHYSDAGFCIIQQVIEDVTGKAFTQVMKEYIFDRLRMNDSYYLQTIEGIDETKFASGHNKNGEVVEEKYPLYPYPAASGLWTTPSDLAKVIIEVFNALKGKSQLNISAPLANEMLTGQLGKSWAGLGVFLENSEKGLEVISLGWGVGFQCMLVAYPSVQKAMVIMTNAELGVHQMKGIIGEIYNSLILN